MGNGPVFPPEPPKQQISALFPAYTIRELRADRVVHLVGLPAAIGGMGCLLVVATPIATAKLIATLIVYGAGLLGMLGASAAYHLSRPGRAKEIWRRVDHSMIFAMIAGTYTPFALNVLPNATGSRLCAALWLVAAVGISVTLAFPRRLERLLLGVYLVMGWSIVGMFGTLLTVLPTSVTLLLLLGGIVYSVGSMIQLLQRLPFHNVVWHALVLLGAGLHLAALAVAFSPPA
jgi:hemolysin III